jgi:hypothetical protein
MQRNKSIRSEGDPMRFYTETHQHYCGIDLHAKTMYLCILDREYRLAPPRLEDDSQAGG